MLVTSNDFHDNLCIAKHSHSSILLMCTLAVGYLCPSNFEHKELDKRNYAGNRKIDIL